MCKFLDWNRDHTLRSAIAASPVSVYQEIAGRVGTDRMRTYVESSFMGTMISAARPSNNCLPSLSPWNSRSEAHGQKPRAALSLPSLIEVKVPEP